MIQLAFEPAYDPFHGAFRVIRQVLFKEGKPLGIPRMKINDLFIVEPRRCLEIRLTGELKTAAKKAATCQKPVYGQRPSANNLFDRMAPMQDAAIQTLVNRGILDADAFAKNEAMITDRPLPQTLVSRVLETNSQQIDLMRFLLEDLEKIPFEGVGGLKDRTKLGEFRYDTL